MILSWKYNNRIENGIVQFTITVTECLVNVFARTLSARKQFHFNCDWLNDMQMFIGSILVVGYYDK